MALLQDFIILTKEIFAGIFDTFSVKILPTLIIPSAGFLFGYDNFLSLQALLVLIVIDFITGIASAKKSGEEIKSKKVVKSAFKIGIYGMLVSSANLTETIAPGTTYMVETMTTFLALTELISILENAGKLGFAVPQKWLNQLHKWRDEETITTEVATTHTMRDNILNTVETHKVVEKTEEKRVVEKPTEPLG